jgi:hypothetical protein
MRIRTAHLVVLLPCLLVACGDDRVSATTSESASSTTNMSSTEGSESSTGPGSESGTESDSETETGEPSNPCGCMADELCVAIADDACTEDFGYTLECVPAVAACADNMCDPDCLDAVCNDDICTPPCGQVPGIDVWCSSSSACDPIDQNCPEGEKCVPYASQGGNWDDNKCVPVTGDNMIGEACLSNGVVEGSDDCDENGMCFGLDDEGLGTCYGFCEPGELCPDGQACFIANDESIALCLDTCVPHHSENCAAGTACEWAQEQYMCLPTATLPPDSPCLLGEYCALGQTCVAAIVLDSCAAEACCTDWCDTSQPDPCELPLTCEPYWPQGQAPAGLETAGVCKLG